MVARGKPVVQRATLRLVENDDDDDAAALPEANQRRGRNSDPLPLGVSLLIWALMAALAWAVVAAALHFL